MAAFFHFHQNLNRLFNNFKKILDKFFLKYEGGVTLTPPTPPFPLPSQKKLLVKSPALLGLNNNRFPYLLKTHLKNENTWSNNFNEWVSISHETSNS